MGILWKRANGKAAFITLITGFILGAIRFIAEIAVKAGWITWRPLVAYATINFLHFAILLFVISIAILVLVSLTSAAPNRKQLEIFQQSDTELQKFAGSHRSHNFNVRSSVILAAIVLVFWVVFSPFVLS